jgi:hypothetical protein
MLLMLVALLLRRTISTWDRTCFAGEPAFVLLLLSLLLRTHLLSVHVDGDALYQCDCDVPMGSQSFEMPIA